MSDSLLNGFTVGSFRVLPRHNRLEGPDGAHQVEPKVMEVLLALAARPGELVSRQALLDEVWGDVVVLDETLTKAIQMLRGYFDDKPTSPTYIRTVPRKGYELIAPVGRLDASAAAGAPPSADPVAAPGFASGGSDGPARGRWLAGAAGILLLIGIAAGLAQLVNPTRHETVTVAVIPPVALGDSAELGFVGEGLADYLIDQLSRTARLQVVARRSSFGMRDTDTNVRAIGEQLGAGYLVEGSLREENAALLLTLFLVDTETGTNVWTTQLRGVADDVSRLQQRSAEALRGAFKSRLGISVEAVADRRLEGPEQAYRKFLEARYQWTLRGERRIDRSIGLLQDALAIEPGYAAAHLALAQSVAVRPFYTDEPVARDFERARASAARALALNPGLAAEVSALEGFMRFKEHRWSEAQASLLEALDRDPDNVNARYWYSWFLSQIGRYQEALSHLLVAQKLDPVSAVVNDRLAIAYLWVGDLAKAAERYQIAVDLGYLESTQPLSLMMFQYRSKRFAELKALLGRLGGDGAWIDPAVYALEHQHARPAAAEVIDAVTRPDPVLQRVRFGLWLLLEETERAFRDFDPELKSPYVEALWLPEAAHLRSDPRFEALLQSLGFDQADRRLLPGG